MTLQDCTKAELIEIIQRVSMDAGVAWHVERHLNEINYQRERKKLDEADRVRHVADEKRREYRDLLAPYVGKRIRDIPPSVAQKAAEAAEAADAADARWYRLMGFKQM